MSGDAPQVSIKDLVAAIAEAQKPMFADLGKSIVDALEAAGKSTKTAEVAAAEVAEKAEQATKSAREVAIEALVKEAQAGDGNSARFLAMLQMTPDQRQGVLDGEAKQARNEGKGLKFARVLRAAALAKKSGLSHDRIPSLVADTLKDKSLADLITKAPPMTSGDPAAGGFLTHETVADEIIPLLRAATFLGKLGARAYPMPSDKVHIPSQTAAGSATWIGETRKPTATKPSTGRKSLSVKRLAAFVAISDDLLRDTSGMADQLVRDDLVNIMAIEKNRAAIYGAGTEYEPRGLKLMDIQSYSTAARVDPDTMVSILEKLWTANIPMLSPGTLGNYKVKRDFMTLKSANGEYYYRSELAQDKLEGCTAAWTSMIPTSGNAYGPTDFFVGDWSEFFYGERTAGGLMLDTSNQAAWYDGSNTRYAFQEWETVLRVIELTDFNVRHDDAFVKSVDVYTADT